MLTDFIKIIEKMRKNPDFGKGNVLISGLILCSSARRCEVRERMRERLETDLAAASSVEPE